MAKYIPEPHDFFLKKKKNSVLGSYWGRGVCGSISGGIISRFVYSWKNYLFGLQVDFFSSLKCNSIRRVVLLTVCSEAPVQSCGETPSPKSASLYLLLLPNPIVYWTSTPSKTSFKLFLRLGLKDLNNLWQNSFSSYYVTDTSATRRLNRWRKSVDTWKDSVGQKKGNNLSGGSKWQSLRQIWKK